MSVSQNTHGFLKQRQQTAFGIQRPSWGGLIGSVFAAWHDFATGDRSGNREGQTDLRLTGRAGCTKWGAGINRAKPGIMSHGDRAVRLGPRNEVGLNSKAIRKT
jgi:hypothetical protein